MPGFGEATVVAPAFGDHRHGLIAVDDVALLVDDDHAVGVAVERDADVGPHLAHLARQRLRRGRSDVLVDVIAAGLDADLDDFRAKLPQRLGRHLVGRAVGAVDDDPHALERDVPAQRPLGELDVARLHIVNALGAAEFGRAGEHRRDLAVHQRLDPRLDLVRQLVAVRSEQLDAVVLVRVVRGGDHHAEVAAHRPGDHRDGRRRRRSEQQNVDADRGEAGDQRIFDHVARQARVLADHHPVAVLAAPERHARRLTDLQRDVGGDLDVGLSPDPVGAEIFARHAPRPPKFRRRLAGSFALNT